MTNQEIENRMENLVKTERKITREILNLINLIDERKILAKVQSSIRIQERASGEKLSVERKMELIEKVEGKTFNETEKTLMQELPQLALSVHQEKRVKVDENTTRLSTNISDKALKDIERIRELFAHQLHGASLSEIIEFMAERVLKEKMGSNFKSIEKLKTEVDSPTGVYEAKNNLSQSQKVLTANPQNAESAADGRVKRRVTIHANKIEEKILKSVTPRLKRDVFFRAYHQCEYINPVTKKRCTSRYQLEIDHVQPRALGGDNRHENLRCLCRAHNQFMAMKNLGVHKMNQWKTR
jgi:5-methylcytosine-specific restriction endonuclease McrA